MFKYLISIEVKIYEWVSYTNLTYLHNVYETVSRRSLLFTITHKGLSIQIYLISQISF